MYFYPRSPCGERHNGNLHSFYTSRISIHALLAESDSGPSRTSPWVVIFLSTLSLRRATKIGHRRPPPCRHFYPRSPCGERQNLTRGRVQLQRISIHALLAESDVALAWASVTLCGFLSTLSLRRATGRCQPHFAQDVFLSTLSLRRATRSIFNSPPYSSIFLSTLSLRRATLHFVLLDDCRHISIHALLAESDRILWGFRCVG